MKSPGSAEMFLWEYFIPAAVMPEDLILPYALSARYALSNSAEIFLFMFFFLSLAERFSSSF